MTNATSICNLHEWTFLQNGQLYKLLYYAMPSLVWLWDNGPNLCSHRSSPKNSDYSFESGFQDTGRNKKSIRQTERRGRENVIDWDEDLGCLAVLNLSLPLISQTLCLSIPSFHSVFIYSFHQPDSISPSPLVFSLCPLIKTILLTFCLAVSSGPNKL